MVTITICTPRGGAAHKLADVELVFAAPPLAGLKLVGLAVWATRDGPPAVTFPARSTQGETGIRYFNFLRPAAAREGDRPPPAAEALAPLKAAILAAYHQAITRAA